MSIILRRRLTPLILAFTTANLTGYDSQRPITNLTSEDKAVTTSLPQGEAYLRVVDVGNALCVVAKVPTGETLLYDAGNHNTNECADAVAEIIGPDTPIDLVVLSHSDADHIGELPEILARNHAKQLVYTGAVGTSKTLWPRVVEALDIARTQNQTRIRNLGTEPLPNTIDANPGAPLTVNLGAAKVTFVAGWHAWPYRGDPGAALAAAEKLNVISIVVRYDYGNQSVLLTGDTIGRRGEPDEDPNACRDAERWMIEKSGVPLKSDVLVGEHHGGDNSSSNCFIKAVSPSFVIFPAGHATYHHPRETAAQRYLAHNIPLNHILRTDRGDDDKGDDEWAQGLEAGCVDPAGDDDVEIRLSGRREEPVVQYRQPWIACAPRPRR